MYNGLKENGRINEHDTMGYQLADRYQLADSSIRRIQMMLHEAMDAAVREHLVVDNSTNGTRIPKPNYPPKQILTEEQMERFMTELENDAVWHDFFYTELTTGLRRGEICGLQWQDLDFATGKLRIRRAVITMKHQPCCVGETKTNAGKRTITLPSHTLELLKNRKKTSYSQWIFPNPVRPEAPMTPSTPYHQMKRLLKQAGLPSIRFHDLRHTFATMALENGMDMKTLSEMLGHVSAATTLDVYSHVTDTMEQQAAIKIDRKFGKGDAPLPQAEKPRVKDQRDFQAVEGNRRRPGTGCLHQIGDRLWEGRYSCRDENGKRVAKNVYAKTKEECELKLQTLITEMRAQANNGENRNIGNMMTLIR